ncbi:GNAT family N-acetyltransferase [Oscillospiraceae bacterium MB08-C2-2]|nr:GNAT family N-acetyltransferase [Oscillospiraceae bacterium MB08-C2-2]
MPMEFKYESNRIFLPGPDGESIAYVTFPHVKEGVVDLDHTFVDPSLRGQGVADLLMQAAVKHIQSQGLRIRPTCPYARKWFAAHARYAQLLEG